jgi:FkbM family methyltransferase
VHEQPVEMNERGVKSYAQSGEDLQIAYYVGRERISYIDVGCLWPRQYSNSYFFYERGGSGLCIDPNPTIAHEYTSARPRDLFVNCGIAATEGSMSYYMHNNPVFNTFSAEHAAELQRRVQAMEDSPQREGRSQTGVVEVPITTLDRAVDSSGLAKRCDGRLDFLSIDVEGLELEVLSGFSFQALRPRLVVVEDVRRGARTKLSPEQLPATRALAPHRYWLAGWSGFNLYFMDEDG